MAAKKITNHVTASEVPKSMPAPMAPPEESEESSPIRRGPPVVGIRASAGALEAFRKLFSTMAGDSGLAFVLIPHFDPTHESLMMKLLARSTAIPVVKAEEEMPVEANHVHALPPNRYMTIDSGKLHLACPVERGGVQTSIDLFLRSLTEDRHEQAIDIVLCDVLLIASPRRDDVGQTIGLALAESDFTDRRLAHENLESLVKERTSQLEATNRELQADISEHQRAKDENLRLNAELEHRVQELQALLDVLPVGVGISLDPECRRIRGNQWAMEFLQLPPNTNMSTSAPPGERAAYKVCQEGRELAPKEQPMRKACAGNMVIRDAEEEIVLPDGQVRAVSVSAAPLHDQSGNVRGCVGVFWDVTERKRALRGSWDRIAAIVNTVSEGIITIDKHGTIESVNPSAERIFGYASAEMIGQNVKILMPSPYQESHDGYLTQYLRTGTKKIIGAGREVSGRRKDGSTFPLYVSVSELHDGNQRLFTGILRDVTDRKALEREVLEIAVKEQRRIGHDLHDTVGQELTALGLMADSLVAALRDNYPTDVPLAAKIAQGLRRTLGQVRALAVGLVPVEVADHGLTAALAELTARVNGESGVDCTFACENVVLVEDNVTATHLYRIAQEAVSNALKHSSAKHIEVGLELAKGLLTLRIRDDGVGIRNQQRKAEGLGLRIMRYRADLIRATFAVEPAAQGGTLVSCILNEEMVHDQK